MNNREYLQICKRQPLEWLEIAASDPGPYMRPIHVILAKIAIRQKRASF